MIRIARSVPVLGGLLAIAVIGAGCGATPGPGDSGPLLGPSATADRDGVRVTLTLDRASLPAGGRTVATVIVDNTSADNRFWRGGGCDEVADLTIDTAAAVAVEQGKDWPGAAGRFKQLLLPAADPSARGGFLDERFSDASQVACPADLRVNELGPGQRLAMRAIWNGEVNGVVAAAGPAHVAAAFPYLGRNRDVNPSGGPADPQPIVATVDVTVVDRGIHLLSPGQAIDAALANPEFAAWLAAAGQIQGWDSVSLEGHGHILDVVLGVQGVQGRASVDRATGVVSFAKRPRP